jgi:hypothetical protein
MSPTAAKTEQTPLLVNENVPARRKAVAKTKSQTSDTEAALLGLPKKKVISIVYIEHLIFATETSHWHGDSELLSRHWHPLAILVAIQEHQIAIARPCLLHITSHWSRHQSVHSDFIEIHW